MTDRELNALVARSIFNLDVGKKPEHNWRPYLEDGWCGQQYDIGYGESSTCMSEDTKECAQCFTVECGGPCEQRGSVFGCVVGVRPYSIDIGNAFLVVEEMRKRDWWAGMVYRIDLGEQADWFVQFRAIGIENVTKPSAEVGSPLLPRSICLASLKALGVELPA